MNTGLFNKAYNLISDFGSAVAEYFKKIFSVIFLSPVLFCFSFIKKYFKQLKRKIRRNRLKFIKEKKYFKKDLRRYFKNPKKYKRKKVFYKEHKPFFAHCLSLILPVAAIIFVILFVNFEKRIDFALKVTYNNVDIGYIENEQVFKQAEIIIKDRLSYGGQSYSTDVISKPEYNISVVHKNELSDSTSICEKIIENSNSGLITACGVYVDEKFICCVKNESDAAFVFKNIIYDYCKKNKIDDKDSKYIVDLVENITYSQGLYSEKTLFSSEQLSEYIESHKKSESFVYKANSSDTVSSVEKKFGLIKEQLYALNPSLQDDDTIKDGMKINVIRSTPFINISVSKTVEKTKEIKYKTIKVNSASMYKGSKKVVCEGKNGEKIVTNLITYVNGEKISEKEINSVITVQPVDEKIYVGTKPVPVNVGEFNSDTESFIWPTIGANYVTSPFGFRILYGEENFHRGCDISGMNALGKSVIASAPGIVEIVQESNTNYGYCVLINHGNGLKTRYAHLLQDSILVEVGDYVEQGQVIAQVGSTGNSTGPHLHFEIIYNGAYCDPLKYLQR